MTKVSISEFIARWEASGAAERANYALFIVELCDVLDAPRPDPQQADEAKNVYVFEKAVTFNHVDGSQSHGRIDLYKRGCFVLEAKQGVERQVKGEGEMALVPAKAKTGTAVRGTQRWDMAMIAARGQADGYARALPASEGWPPFILVVDVGHLIEVYADFSGLGKAYQQFPDAQSFRIKLKDLVREEVRERLRLIWTNPTALDPARRSAAVTQQVAALLAELAKSLEHDRRLNEIQRDPSNVAFFLMRCLFTMFAEDVGLLDKGSFTRLLAEIKDQPEIFVPMVENLWVAMNKG